MMGVYHITISWHFLGLHWRGKQIPISIKTTGLANNHVINTRVNDKRATNYSKYKENKRRVLELTVLALL